MVILGERADVDVVVEMVGGSDGPALACSRTTIEAGKALVTANKAMIPHHGLELAAKAEGSEFEFDNKAWQFGIDAWRGVGYGHWQRAVQVTMV